MALNFVDQLTLMKSIDRKKVSDLVLSHQMQIKAMFIKKPNSQSPQTMKSMLEDGRSSPRQNPRISLNLDVNFYHPGYRRLSYMSQAESSVELSTNRQPSRDRSKGNVSICKKSEDQSHLRTTCLKL